ncbi:acyltransferase [Pseudomonadales bacterium]|nr:acyltransferase [Pseudomonadales bacterium]
MQVYEKKIRNLNIDALRGVAVLGVLIYHSFPNYLPGGWLGVDVFFVISGFLMADLLSRDVRISEFLIRRFLRLWTPVFIVISTIVAVLIVCSLLEVNIPVNSRELIYSSLFISNIYYFFNVDYFSSPDSPFIHFWSLGVEAQYYILIALVSVVYRSFNTYIVLILVGIAFEYFVRFGLSGFYLGVSEQELINEASVSSFLFYMLPTRLWEFGAGGLVFYISRNRSVNLDSYWFFFLALYILLFLLARDFTLVDRLLAVFATCALLCSNRCPGFAKPFWKLGRFSYSLYLVHMPLIFLFAGDVYMLLIAVSLSLVMGKLLYLFGEVWLASLVQRYRFSSTLFSAVTLFALSSAAYFLQDAHKASLGNELLARQVYLEDSKKFVQAQKISFNTEFEAPPPKGAKRIAIVGDSMASDILGGFDLLADDLSDVYYKRFGLSHKCHFGEYDRLNELRFSKDRKLAESCNANYELLLNEVADFEPDIVLISFNWYSLVNVRGLGFVDVELVVPVRQALERLQGLLTLSSKLYVIGKRPAFLKTAESPYDSFLNSEMDKGDFEHLIYQKVFSRSSPEDEALTLAVRGTRAKFVDYKNDIFCDATAEVCSLFAGRRLTLRDSIHWTREGARIFTSRLMEMIL